MSDRNKLSMNNALLFIITIMLSVIGYFYIDETHDQEKIDDTQTEAIKDLLEVSRSHNDRLTKVETKVGLY